MATNRVSNDQLEELLEYLNLHPALAKGVGLGARSKEMIDKQWNDLAAKLNSYGSGSSKSGERWRKYWADIKHKSKARLTKQRREALSTGGGPSNQVEVSEIDKKVLSIIGEQAVFGDREHTIPVFNTELNPISTDTPTIPNELLISNNEANDNQNYFIPTIENSPSTRGQTCTIYSSELPVSTIMLRDHTDTLPQHVPEPSQTGIVSPVSRPRGDRTRLRRNRLNMSNTTTQSKIDPQWVMDLEKRRVDAEEKLAKAALIMAEASRSQTEMTRALVDLVATQNEHIRKLIELTQKPNT